MKKIGITAFSIALGTVAAVEAQSMNVKAEETVDESIEVAEDETNKNQEIQETMKNGWSNQQYYVDGNYLVGFQYINGARYYFNQDGYYVIGQQTIDGLIYVFDETGQLQTGFQTVKDESTGSVSTVYVNETGDIISGEQIINGKTYFFNVNGSMYTGWRTFIDETNTIRTVYYGSDGAMLYGEYMLEDQIYYFDPKTGYMVTGEAMVDAAYSLSSKGKISIYSSTGQLLSGTYTIGNVTYNTDSNGNIINTIVDNIQYLNQADSKWKNKQIGLGLVAQTGCVPTVATMVINYFKGTNYTPYEIGVILNNNGLYNYGGVGTSAAAWKFISNYFGIEYKNNLSEADIVNELKQGRLVTQTVGYSAFSPYSIYQSHQLLLYGYEADGYTNVIDPYNKNLIGKYKISYIYSIRSKLLGDNVDNGPAFSFFYKEALSVKRNDFDQTGTYEIAYTYDDNKTHNVQISIWTKTNKSDLLTYNAVQQADGVYKVINNISDHNEHLGKYYAQIFVNG